MATTVLKGNLVHAPRLGELEILEQGYLVLEDGIIAGLYPTLPEEYRSARLIDYGKQILTQSFADLHVHAPQWVMTGMGMDLPLLDWLKTYVFPTEAKFSDLGLAREIYGRLAQELIANGTTRVAMFSSLHTDATLILMEELERAGVTGVVGKVNMDRNGVPALQETTADSMAETLRWLDACESFSHIRPILTPRFTPSCTDALMTFLGKLAQERHLPVQSHLSESRAEQAWVRELHPDCARYWETYDKFGLFSDHGIMAHCVYCDEAERAALKSHGVWAVHCADSNINLCSGIAPVRELLDEGVSVALGTDAAGGASVHMFDAVTMAIRGSKLRHLGENSPAFLSVAEGFYLGTTAGHRYFGGGAGFAVGDPLHAMVIDDAQLPLSDSYSVRERFERCVYLRQPGAITAVWSEGRCVR
ncbi:MAG: amidohydrolase family protein [Oscillospiraceae bacterium]